MNGSNHNTAPRICILGYGRLAEALAEKLGRANCGISVFTRRPPREGANNVHFFGDVRQGNCSPLALAGSLGSEHRAAGKAGADGGESA